jgi:hypothetical protein
MRTISPATPITLTSDDRAALQALANSRKSEARMRDQARIVPLAVDGLASRAVGRAVGYTPDRLAGLSETGERGTEPRYGPEHDRRILALLDRPPPAGHANWSAPVLARESGDIHEQYIWRFLRAEKIDLSGRKT